MSQLRNQLDVGHGLVENDPVDAAHVLRDQVEYGGQALRRIASLVYMDNNAHALALLI